MRCEVLRLTYGDGSSRGGANGSRPENAGNPRHRDALGALAGRGSRLVHRRGGRGHAPPDDRAWLPHAGERPGAPCKGEAVLAPRDTAWDGRRRGDVVVPL